MFGKTGPILPNIGKTAGGRGESERDGAGEGDEALRVLDAGRGPRDAALPPVRAADAACVPRRRRREPEAALEEKLARVVSRLVVDVHVPCEIRRFPRVRPPRIRAPRSFLRHQQDFPRRRGAPFRRGRAFGDFGVLAARAEEVRHRRHVAGIPHVHVGYFVVRHREGLGEEDVRVRHALDPARQEKALFAEEAVREGGRGGHLRDGVVAERRELRPRLFRERREAGKLRSGGGEGLPRAGVLRAEALEVVVEGREIHEKVVRVRPARDGFGVPRDGVADFA